MARFYFEDVRVMARYNSVLNSMWDDPAFQAWSADAKLIFLNFITSPRHNPLGLYAVTPATLQFETGLPQTRFDAAFQELQQPVNGYARVRYDTEKSVVWIVNTIKHQPSVTPKNLFLWKHVHAVLEQYESASFITEVVALCKSKGLARGLQGATKDTYKDKDKDKALRSTKGIVKGEQPHQTIINRYLALSGTARETLTLEQVTGAYKRHSRSALALISEAGGLAHALNALEVAAAYFTKKALTWTLDTVAKHLPKLEGYRHELLAQRNGLTRHQLDQLGQLATWIRAGTLESDKGRNVPCVVDTGVPNSAT